jgi:transposase-like protein
MAKHRTHSIQFKRQVVQEYLGGETLYGLAKRHEISRTLIRVWGMVSRSQTITLAPICMPICMMSHVPVVPGRLREDGCGSGEGRSGHRAPHWPD